MIAFIAVSVLVVGGRAVWNMQAQTQDEGQQQVEVTQEEKVQQLLTDEQKSKIDAYDENTKSFLAILKACVWCDSSGKNFIQFYDNYFTDSNKQSDNQANTNEIVFIVDTLKKESYSQNGASGVKWTAVVSTNDKSMKFLTLNELTQTYREGNTAKTYTLTSDIFSSSGEYKKVETADYLEISGLNDTMMAYFGNDKAGLEKALKDYMGVNYPYVTKLTYTGTVSVSTEANLNYTTFITSSSSSSKTITVAYDTQNKKFQVAEGQNNVSK